MKTQIDHIALLVDDLEIAERWYLDKLSAKTQYKDHKYIRLELNNTILALISRKHYNYAHFGILVEKYEDLPLDQGQISKHRDGSVGVYAKDPFGNYLEYIWYPSEEKEEF
tara:strand:+ start:14108 stop:14440 length:333 start_codon:yes stop_codon:yes gene_type:complete